MSGGRPPILSSKMKISAFSYRLGATSTALFLGFFLSAPNAFASPLTSILKAALKNSAEPTLIRRTVSSGGRVTAKRYLIEKDCREMASSYYSSTTRRGVYKACMNRRLGRNY